MLIDDDGPGWPAEPTRVYRVEETEGEAMARMTALERKQHAGRAAGRFYREQAELEWQGAVARP